jgi:hypothetical protein
MDAFGNRALRVRPGNPLATTTRTTKTLWPAQLIQVLLAALFAAKPLLKLLQIEGIILHPLACYGLYPGKPSGYPSCKIPTPAARVRHSSTDTRPRGLSRVLGEIRMNIYRLQSANA